MRPWSSWDEEWPVDLDFVNELAAAFLQAGARHIAVQILAIPCSTWPTSPQQPSRTAGLLGPEHYREVVNRDDAEGLQYHVLPTDDPLRALNILREAAALQPLSDEHEEQDG